MLRCIFFLVLCGGAGSLRLAESDFPPPKGEPMSKEQVALANQIAEEMRAAPHDEHVQAEGCGRLRGVLTRVSANNDDVLAAFEAAADGIAAGKTAGLACVSLVGDLAVFNAPMTYLLNRTSAMKNTIAFLRENIDDVRAAHISNNIASMSTMQPIVPYVVQLGGIPVLFDYLERWQEDPHGTLMAWAGLSDPSHAETGARAIADYGGHNKGIEAVMQMIASYPPHFGESPDTLTVRYESLQIVNGMLEHDNTNEFGKAFMEAGLVEEILKTMKTEWDMRAANAVCCQILNTLFNRGNSEAMVPILQSGDIISIINTTYTTFHDDNTYQWNGETVGYYYKVIPECSATLSNMIKESPESKQDMLQIGVPKSLENVRQEFKYSPEVRDLKNTLRKPPLAA